jgi:hypothetical protein
LIHHGARRSRAIGRPPIRMAVICMPASPTGGLARPPSNAAARRVRTKRWAGPGPGSRAMVRDASRLAIVRDPAVKLVGR